MDLVKTADALRSLGRYDEALAMGERALAIERKRGGADSAISGDAHDVCALLLCELGRLDEALEHIDMAVAITGLQGRVGAQKQERTELQTKILDAISRREMRKESDKACR